MTGVSQSIEPNNSPSNLEVFFEMLDVPIYCNLLWSQQQAAKNCPKGDIRLAFNPSNGLISNIAFDPTKLDYDRDYENSLHYSLRFQQYAQSLTNDLVKRYQLDNKDIIEIGCGKGDFLISLCELGNSRGIGFDPTYIPRSEHEHMSDRVTIIQDFYSEKYRDYQADLICCRHTLEHVTNPEDLLKPLRQAIGDRLNTAVFFEVPNSLHTFRSLAIWDIIYEHCLYFVPTSLIEAFISHGFKVEKVTEVFEGQFICLEATPVESDRVIYSQEVESLETLKQDLVVFKDKFQATVDSWVNKLTHFEAEEKKVVVWGAGSKGVTFLNIFKDRGSIDYIVDLNPRKQGMYLPGSGQKIVPPEFLQNYQPDVVIIMNPIYIDEIRQSIANLGLSPELICV